MNDVVQTFTCQSCGKTFAKAWTDTEAAMEFVQTFERALTTEDAIVCEDCFSRLTRGRDRGKLRELGPVFQKIAAEGNRFEWESSGYLCLLKRTRMANLCGYVTVPSDHPWSQVHYDARVTPLPERGAPEGIAPPIVSMFLDAMERADQPPDGLAKMDLCIVVHGGLTWSAPRDTLHGENGITDWTFGFDCAHAGDLVPGMHVNLPAGALADDVYRDRDYVVGEASRLAAQLRIVHRRGYR